MRIEDLTPEQAERIKSCETPEEMLSLMAEDGVELTDEQLESVAGGLWEVGSGSVCPASPDKKHDWVFTGRERYPYNYTPGAEAEYRCENCGKVKWDSIAHIG